MKKFLIVLLLVVITTNAFAAQITFTIPNGKLARVVAAMKGLYPIPTDENGDPLFTDNQWAKEAVRRWIVDSVARYEHTAAKQAIPYDPDDDIVQ